MIKQIYQEWKERRKARIEECRNWMPESYRITPGRDQPTTRRDGQDGATRRKRVKGAVRRQGEARPLTLREPTRLLLG